MSTQEESAERVPMFLGRRLSPQTMCFGDIPVEVAQGIEDLAVLRLGEPGQALMVLDAIEKAKERS